MYRLFNYLTFWWRPLRFKRNAREVHARYQDKPSNGIEYTMSTDGERVDNHTSYFSLTKPLVASEWQFLAEGSAHVVLRYCGRNPKLAFNCVQHCTTQQEGKYVTGGFTSHPGRQERALLLVVIPAGLGLIAAHNQDMTRLSFWGGMFHV